MLEQPMPPSRASDESKDQELARLREEVKRMRSDMAFLRRLLEHMQEEFARLRR